FVFMSSVSDSIELYTLSLHDALPIFLAAVIAPWHYLVYRANGQIFLDEYWYLHHVKLLSGSEFNHVQPVYYYILWLLVGFFPWRDRKSTRLNSSHQIISYAFFCLK